MAEHQPSDEEIIAEEHRRSKRAFIAGIAVALGISVVMTGVEFVIRAGILQNLGIPSSAGDTILPWLLIALISIVVPFVVWHYRPPKAAMSERILRKQIDVHHRRWRLLILTFLFGFPLFTFTLTHRPPHTWFSPVILVFDAVVYAGIVCFGPGFLRKTYRKALNDELTHSLRTRAVRLGYLVLVVMLGGAYLAILYRPGLAPVILPWLLAVAVSVPLTYFLFLEWRASRSR